MIRSFRHKGLEQFHRTGSKAGVQPSHSTRLAEILFLLQSARNPQSLDLPGLRLHRLSGDLAGFWSVRVSGAWRAVFRFEDGHAWEIDYVQYH
jgi:proteic killer suppression protein